MIRKGANTVNELKEGLELLFGTYAMPSDNKILISTPHNFDGEYAGVYFEECEGHSVRLTSHENFNDWMDHLTLYPEYYSKEVEAISKRYGTEYSFSENRLTLKFRRNEMTLAEGIMRISKAMYLLGSLKRTIELREHCDS